MTGEATEVFGPIKVVFADANVLAAAVSARAEVLCTNNVKDFPPEAMASAGVELLTADALLSRLVTMHPSRMRDAHRTTVASLIGRRMSRPSLRYGGPRPHRRPTRWRRC